MITWTDLVDEAERLAVGPQSRSVRGHLLDRMHERDLLMWSASAKARMRGSLLDLIGLGAEVWQDVDPVEYVRNLREEWP